MLRTQEAAKILGLRKCTLEAWRCRGGGPDFVKLGRSIRYRQEDLNRFITDNIRRNTSEGGQARAEG